MRIGINAQIVSLAAGYRQAGVSRFTEQAVRALQQRDSTNRYTVFVNSAAQGRFTDSAGMAFRRTHLPAAKPLVRILWEQLLLPVLAAGSDVLHCPVNVAPLASPVPTVLTIHDLSFLRFPDRFRPERRSYLALLTKLSAHRARRIMTDSMHTKRDVVSLLGVPDSQVEVVYPGLDPSMRRPTPAEIAAFRAAQGLPAEFVLYLGTLEPRKNVDLLIQAYALLKGRASRTCPLVLAGGTGWMADRIFSALDRSGIRESVILPGYVDAADLPLWYSAATLFVYPSLYEGFGLPPLEAMACGTPVVVSSASSLPEVVGQAGAQIDPHSVDHLAQVLANLLDSPSTRAQMTAAGLQQAASFTWDRAAAQMMRVYAQAAQDEPWPRP